MKTTDSPVSECTGTITDLNTKPVFTRNVLIFGECKQYIIGVDESDIAESNKYFPEDTPLETLADQIGKYASIPDVFEEDIVVAEFIALAAIAYATRTSSWEEIESGRSNTIVIGFPRLKTSDDVTTHYARIIGVFDWKTTLRDVLACTQNAILTNSDFKEDVETGRMARDSLFAQLIAIENNRQKSA